MMLLELSGLDWNHRQFHVSNSVSHLVMRPSLFLKTLKNIVNQSINILHTWYMSKVVKITTLDLVSTLPCTSLNKFHWYLLNCIWLLIWKTERKTMGKVKFFNNFQLQQLVAVHWKTWRAWSPFLRITRGQAQCILSKPPWGLPQDAHAGPVPPAELQAYGESVGFIPNPVYCSCVSAISKCNGAVCKQRTSCKSVK